MGVQQPVFNMPVGANGRDSFWRIYGFTPLSMAEIMADGYRPTSMNTSNLEGEQFMTLDGLYLGSRDSRTIGQSWSRPTVDSEIAFEPKFVDSMSGKRYAYGGKKVLMKFQNHSPYQAQFVWQYVMFSGYSRTGSMVIYNRLSNAIEAYAGVLRFPDPSTMSMGNGGFSEYTIELANGVELDTGPMMVLSSPSMAYMTVTKPDALLPQASWSSPLSKKRIDFNVPASTATGNYNLIYTNSGDADTYDSIGYESASILTFVLDSGDFTINAIAPHPDTAGTTEYTTDRGSTWNPTPAVGVVNGVRITASGPVSAGDDFGLILNTTFPTTGFYRGTLSLSTYYDSYPVDNELPVTVTVT